MTHYLGTTIREDISRMLSPENYYRGMCDVLFIDEFGQPFFNPPQLFEDDYRFKFDEEYPLEIGDLMLGPAWEPESYKIYLITEIYSDSYTDSYDGLWVGCVYLRPGDAEEPSPYENWQEDFWNTANRRRLISEADAVGIGIKSLDFGNSFASW